MKFNIGCGKRNFGEEWIHIDGGDFPHINSSDIYLNKYKDNTADLIYASHFIEYFNRDEILELLRCWKKKLKKNGVMRLAVPDFEACSNLYLNEGYGLENFLGPLYGQMTMSGKLIYHKTVFDFLHLKKLLSEVGMNKVKKYNWRETEHSIFDDHSQAYLPHMDKKNGKIISLNVECIK